MKRLTFILVGLLMGSAFAEPDLTEGKRLYFESGGYGCVVCHGLVAEGGGQAGGFIRGANLEALNRSLADNDPMKPLASVLSSADRQSIIAYLRSLGEIPLVQLRFENGQWTAIAQPLQSGQIAELIAYNASFESQEINLSALGLGSLKLPALGSDSRQWQANNTTFSLPGVLTQFVESFTDKLAE